MLEILKEAFAIGLTILSATGSIVSIMSYYSNRKAEAKAKAEAKENDQVNDKEQ